MLHLDPVKFADHDAVNVWMAAIDTLLPEDMAEKMQGTDGPDGQNTCFYGSYASSDQDQQPSLSQYVVVEQKALTPPVNPSGVRVGCLFNDDEAAQKQPDFQRAWNGFLRLYNYYQFLPYSYCVTSSGIHANAYDGIRLFDDLASEAGVSDQRPARDAWDALKELTDVQIHVLLDLLRENKWPLPEAGYELQGPDGAIVATAELGWEALKMAFLTDAEMVFQDQFVARGWKAMSLAEIRQTTEYTEYTEG